MIHCYCSLICRTAILLDIGFVAINLPTSLFLKGI
uniref:Uncharacterized protein n=1 Tax=Rhizophora mucronata TaxID=61149 RepID=A0A2P2P9W1_RHIMU